MNPRTRELARAILAGCAKTEEIHELARAVLVAPDLPPYPDDLRAEIDRLERESVIAQAILPRGVAGSWRMGIREAVSALRPYLSGMQAEIERMRSAVGALASEPESYVFGDGVFRGCGPHVHFLAGWLAAREAVGGASGLPAERAPGRDVCRGHVP